MGRCVRRPGSEPRRAGRPARLATLGSIAALLFVLFADWRLHALLFRPSSAPPDRSVRILQWNTSFGGNPPWPTHVDQVNASPGADIILLSNPGGGNKAGDFSPALGPDSHTVRIDRFLVATRFPILRTGFLSLELPSPAPDATANPSDTIEESPDSLFSFIPKSYMRNHDPGSAAFAVLDTTPRLGRPITIWLLDLPSNPRFSRLSLAKLTRRNIAAAGVPDPTRAFPAPDIIAGDLNIPAHSASLRLLAPGMTDSAAQAGIGYIATWPRRRPVYQLDHVMLSHWLRADRYRVIDPGMAEHRMEWVDVTLR
jgi:hypothetical protein